MDEQLTRQLIRQLKFINFWITLFGTLILIGFVITGFLIYKVVTFTQDTTSKLNNLQQKTEQTLNVQQKLCDTSSVGSLLKKQTGICN